MPVSWLSGACRRRPRTAIFACYRRLDDPMRGFDGSESDTLAYQSIEYVGTLVHRVDASGTHHTRSETE